jgi:hypothetical protein
MSDQPIQRSRAELRRMPPEEIVRADRAGELAELLAGRDPGKAVPDPQDEPRVLGSADQGARGERPQGQLTRADLQTMSSAEIVRAQDEGRLDQLLGVMR